MTAPGTSLVQPFRGLRPTPEQAQRVAAPPYDVLSTEEARSLAQGNPVSFLHISKPEIDLPAGTDPYAPEVYAKAAENMARLLADGVLVRDPVPAYYVYRVEMGGHRQTGIAGAGSVAAYDANTIRRHELTRPDKEDDRVKQIDAVNAQTGPVFTTHAAHPALARVIAEVTARPPDYGASDVGDAEHSLWAVADEVSIAAVTAAFDELGVIYIADGHHRSAAASRVAADRRAGAGDPAQELPSDRFLMVSFPEDEVQILDYNRVIKDLNGLDAAGLLTRLAAAFAIEPADGPVKPEAARRFGLYLDGRWYALAVKAPPGDDAPAVDRLDVSIMNDLVIEPILGIADQRADPRIDFVGGARGLDYLAGKVDSGDFALAIAYHPISVPELMAVADAGAILPPKVTWFEPKLADGMVSLVLD